MALRKYVLITYNFEDVLSPPADEIGIVNIIRNAILQVGKCIRFFYFIQNVEPNTQTN